MSTPAFLGTIVATRSRLFLLERKTQFSDVFLRIKNSPEKVRPVVHYWVVVVVKVPRCLSISHCSEVCKLAWKRLHWVFVLKLKMETPFPLWPVFEEEQYLASHSSLQSWCKDLGRSARAHGRIPNCALSEIITHLFNNIHELWHYIAQPGYY